jgi:viroplasmin and RNaseH domain-containing protein
MKSEPKYQEPHWNHTTLMEAMYLKGITTMTKSLSFNQMVYVMEQANIDVQMILTHLVNEKFFRKNAKGYCLADLGIFHAKKRIKTMEDSVKEAKGDSEREMLVGHILKVREKFMDMIDEARKYTPHAKDRLGILEHRVSELEEKFKKLGKLLSS